MNNASPTNTAGEKLRIDTNIRARVHDNSAAKQDLSQQLPLCAIGVSFESAIKQAVYWKGTYVGLIPNVVKE
jgi:hypothetical protein